MAPISLKDPNIQSLTEEFVKVLTGFKVIINLMAYEIWRFIFWAESFFLTCRNHQGILPFLYSLHCQTFGKWTKEHRSFAGTKGVF